MNKGQCKMCEILMSVQPQWVEKILNGKKTIEVRKTAPPQSWQYVEEIHNG